MFRKGEEVKSYAQDSEDLILYSMLKGVQKGKYIDVGASDPEHLSVTKLFYDLGWNGLNIEPLDYRHKLLVEQRPNDINLRIALGEKHDVDILYDIDTGSTFKKEIADSYNLNFPTKEVEIFTLSEIYDTYCSDWEAVHFCKIDVEGYEKQVLLGVKDWNKFRPWVFCMESTIPSTDIPCYEEWEYILLKNGYELFYEKGINRYYIDSDKKDKISQVEL